MTSDLVPQEHGGAIYQGAPDSPRAGSGRPPSELRRRLRASLDDRVRVAEEIADDEDQRASDRLRAIDLLAKYGLGANDPGRVSVEEFVSVMRALGEVVADEVSDSDTRKRIEARWRALVQEEAA